MAQKQYVRMLLRRLARPAGGYGELGRIEDFEQNAIDEAYRAAKFAAGLSLSRVNFTLRQARFLVTSWALEQERITGKPHNELTAAGCREVFTKIFLRSRVFDFVIDHDAPNEFFKFLSIERARRATLSDFATWLGGR